MKEILKKQKQRKCEYCDEPLINPMGNRKYCPGKLCATKMNAIKKRIYQMKNHNTLEPRICRRCQKPFKYYGMKKYCLDCILILRPTKEEKEQWTQ